MLSSRQVASVRLSGAQAAPAVRLTVSVERCNAKQNRARLRTWKNDTLAPHEMASGNP